MMISAPETFRIKQLDVTVTNQSDIIGGYAVYTDPTAGADAIGQLQFDVTTNGTTERELFSPASWSSPKTAKLTSLNIFNADTAAQTYELYIDGGTAKRMIRRFYLAPNESLSYDSYNGWSSDINPNDQRGNTTYRTPRPEVYSDFFGNGIGNIAPFTGTVISGGTLAAANTGLITKDHPGVLKLVSGSLANSGYIVALPNASILLGGNEIFEATINVTNFAGTTIRLGFIDTVSSADCVDGLYFEIINSNINVDLKSSSNSTRTTVSRSLTLGGLTGVWYRFRIQMNAAGTQADYSIIRENGTVAASGSITANLPTGAGRFTGMGIVATNSGTVVTDLVHIDHMYFGYAGNVAR